MVKLVAFKVEHAMELEQRGELSYMSGFVTEENLTALQTQGLAYTFVDEVGKVIACCGMLRYHANRGEAWAFFGKDTKRHFLSIHRAILRSGAQVPFKRIECVVDANFEEGHRWAKLLGFTCEAPLMKSYLPDGRDCSLYARIF